MNKAYDAVFQIEVDAEDIAKTSYHTVGNRFRYQCLCCGEEVYLAAADSIIKAPHFRHRRGNNDIDCERYLGQPGSVEHYMSIRKQAKEHIGFCFNIEQKTFECSVAFETHEIEEFSKESRKLSLYSKYYSQPFLSVPINRGNLIPDVANFFTITDYANDYYVSIDSGDAKIKYTDIINRNGRLNIYRVNQSNYHYKRIASSVLYTKYSYIAISEEKDTVNELTSLMNIESEDVASTFITLGRRFYAVQFRIQSLDYNVKLFFQKHGFNLEISESILILWPPMYSRDSLLVSESDCIYVSSSFDLVPHGNVDSNTISVDRVEGDIFEVTFADKVAICEKNVECRIVKEKRMPVQETSPNIHITYADKYLVSEIYDYYMFDKNGCNRLNAGSKVYLSKSDRIVGYKNGHIKEYVFAKPEEPIDKKILIDDIIKYHPKSELFDPDDFMDIETDEIVLSYIESCYRSGQINTVVKQYIKEKLI